MNKIKLIEYILGNISPKTDTELKSMLSKDGIEIEIAKISEELSFISQSTPLIKPSSNFKKNLFSQINDKKEHKLDQFMARLASFFDISKQRATNILEVAKKIDSSEWEKTFISGVLFYHFSGGKSLASAHCGLVHIKAGIDVPNHKHHGKEQMLILSGNARTNSNEIYKTGDLIVSEANSQHSVKTLNNEDCLIAVISFDGVSFNT